MDTNTTSNMYNALRSVRFQPPSIFSTSFPNYPSIGPISGVRFRQAAVNSPEDIEDMEQSKSCQQTQPQSQKSSNPPEDKKGDLMSHSFGEGYSSRSDDDGFGGIYGGNQSLPEDEKVHVSHPEYDKDQGSEVKEKEKARHQTHAHS